MKKEINHPFDLKWDSLSEKQWQAHLAKVAPSNYLADWGYGQALAEEGLYNPKRGVITKGKKVVALIPASYRSYLGGRFSMTKIFRAPLWVAKLTQIEQAAVYGLIRSEFKKSIRHRLMFMPELPSTQKNEKFLRAMGFFKIMTGYSSILVDLTLSPDQWLKDMLQRWRYQLNKAHKQNLDIKEAEVDSDAFEDFLESYKVFKKNTKFSGPSAPFLRALCQNMTGHVSFLQAHDENGPIASILVITHGQTATYLAGITTDAGRQKGGHNILLWRVMHDLKAKGVKKLDLGGVNMKGALGVTRFKEGIRKKKYHLLGIYV